MMRIFLWSCLVACGLLLGCGDGSTENPPSNSSEQASSNSAEGNVLTAPVDYLGAVAKAKQYAEKNIDLASINHAIQMFQAEEGRLPKDLNELVQDHYLGRVPAAPYGTKLVYNPTTGQVSVVKQ
jgi:hypothetical protein